MKYLFGLIFIFWTAYAQVTVDYTGRWVDLEPTQIGCAQVLPGAVVVELEQQGRELSGRVVFTDPLNQNNSLAGAFVGTVGPLGAITGAATFTHAYTAETFMYDVALSVRGGALAGTVANDELRDCGMSTRGKLFYRVELTHTTP